jgi:hypothetical protein
MSRRISTLMALRASGRFYVIVAMCPSSSYVTRLTACAKGGLAQSDRRAV